MQRRRQLRTALTEEMEVEEFEMESCVRGYHVYQHVWDAVVGEILECERETSNPNDRYAVVTKKAENVVGHLPRRISRTCSLFILRGGKITCRVVGRRQYSADLSQGGMEIPCILTFTGKTKEIKKLKSIQVTSSKVKKTKNKIKTCK